jgi:protein-tyrosine phosphatase
MSYRVTFVCTGNICRSPMAESIFRHHAEAEGLDVEVDSSGTGSWHVGDPADDRTVTALRRRGYRSAHTARQFRPEWFGRYDLIVALDEGHLKALRRMAPDRESAEKVRLLREFDPAAVEEGDLDVPDPYYDGKAAFDRALALVEAAMPGLLAEVRNCIGNG